MFRRVKLAPILKNKLISNLSLINLIFNLKKTIHSNSLLRTNTFDYNSMSATHSLKFKSFGVRRISSKHLNNLDIYKKAYEIVLKSNYGKINPGYTKDELKTLDNISPIKRVKLEELMESIKGWSYKCQPIEKVYYIKKTNSKLRPFGVPSMNDKILQTVIKLLIEQECENIISSVSNEFRASQSVRHALHSIRKMVGITWMIEGDIKGYLDNIDYEILANIIKNKLNADRTIIGILHKIFRAGYIVNDKPRHSILGIFQGGTLAATLFNLYLTPLDDFMNKLNDKFQKGPEVLPLKVKSKIYYVRYADAWVVGVAGPKELAENIKEEIRIYLLKELKLEFSLDKTITHISAKEYAKFLGHHIAMRADTTFNGGCIGKPQILVPTNFLKSILIEKGFADNKGIPKYLGKFIFLSDYEIVQRYNYVLRGIIIIYNMADNPYCLRELIYILEYSLVHTLAAKHRTSLTSVFKKYGKPVKVILKTKGLIKKIEFEKPSSLKVKYLNKKYATFTGSGSSSLSSSFNYSCTYDPFSSI